MCDDCNAAVFFACLVTMMMMMIPVMKITVLPSMQEAAHNHSTIIQTGIFQELLVPMPRACVTDHVQ